MVASDHDETHAEGDVQNTLLEKPSDRPVDKYNIVAICCFILGVGVLLPWNAFITVQNYWTYKFRNPLDELVVTDLQRTFNSYLSMAFNLPYIICMSAATYYSHKIKHSLANSICLCLVLATFISVTCLVPINADSWQSLFLAITLCQVLSISVNNGIVQTGVAGLISMLQPQYIGKFLEGQALAGVFTSVLNILILVWKIHAVKSALIYFICSVIGLVLAVASYAVLHSSAFFKSYYNQSLETKLGQKSIEETVKEEEIKTPSIKVLFNLIWKYCLSMLLVLWVTLSVFPAVTAQVLSVYASTDTILANTLFIPVFCFLLFNVGDYIGRLFAKWTPFPNNRPNLLLILCLSRAVFIPLFMLSNLKIHTHLPVVFTHDAFFVVFMAVFALSNGYFMSTIFMLGPKSLEDPIYQQKAGSLLVTCLSVGVNLGSISSLLFVHML